MCRKSKTDLTQEKRGKTTVKSIWPNTVCYIYKGKDQTANNRRKPTNM